MELPFNHPDLFANPLADAAAEAGAAAPPPGGAGVARSAGPAAPGVTAAQALARSELRASSSLQLTAPNPPPRRVVPPVSDPAPWRRQAGSEQASAPADHLDAPETLHPALWRAHQVARPGQAVCASGFAELDRQLPGGGWPAGALTELLLPHPGVGELRLLAPVLVALQQQQRNVMWFNPPAAPCPWALGALGLDMQQQVVVQAQAVQAPPGRAAPGTAPWQAAPGATTNARPRSRQPVADILWALEQALKSGQLGAVLAWLPSRLPADALRRLQLAAQLHEGPVFLLRAAEERSRASAAPLRLLLSAWGPDLLRVAITKRRGPPLAEPLMLELPPVLSAPALARALRGPAREGVAVAAGEGWGGGRGDAGRGGDGRGGDGRGGDGGLPDATVAIRPAPIGPRPLAL